MGPPKTKPTFEVLEPRVSTKGKQLNGDAGESLIPHVNDIF